MTATSNANDFRSLHFARGAMTRQAIIAPQAGRCAPSPGPVLQVARAFGVGVKEVFGCRAQA